GARTRADLQGKTVAEGVDLCVGLCGCNLKSGPSDGHHRVDRPPATAVEAWAALRHRARGRCAAPAPMAARRLTPTLTGRIVGAWRGLMTRRQVKPVIAWPSLPRRARVCSSAATKAGKHD